MGHLFIDLSLAARFVDQPAIGVVRVEREIAKFFVRKYSPEVSFCAYDPATGTLRRLDRLEVRHIASDRVRPPAEDSANGDRATIATADRIGDSPSNGRPAMLLPRDDLEFRRGDVFLTAGNCWDTGLVNRLFHLKRARGLRVAVVLYDLVPLLMPEFAVEGVPTRFARYVLDTLWTADRIYCISENTKRDLRRFAEDVGAPLPSLRRIELGADLSDVVEPIRPPISDIAPDRFILYVSTIEARKNHALLFHVWRRLYEAVGPDRLMPLVLVGRPGWRINDLIATIKAATHLYPSHIKLAEAVSDAELEWLYRNCRFSVYPSLYEGWGLPIAESLSRGKLCIASDTGAVREAAQPVDETLDPLDTREWQKRILRYMESREAVGDAESRIASSYRAPTWNRGLTRFASELASLQGDATEYSPDKARASA